MKQSMGALCASLALAQLADAQPVAPPPVPMVTVSASASANVANDRLFAWVRAEAENANPGAAASDVNARVAKALARIKAVAAVTAQTSGYSTQPMAERGKPTRWRVAQTVTIEGSDFPSIAALVTRLQDEDGMLLSGLSFSVSEAKRRETEDALTQQALTAWRARAQNAARGLGFSAWCPGHVSVSTNDFGRPQPLARGAVAAMAGAPAPVPLEGGTSEVTVAVSGDAVLEAPGGPAR